MPHAHLDATVRISAPADAVFARLQDLSRFNDWNPFPSMDPTTVSTHEGPASGPGAIFTYEGKRLGKGRMEITSVEAPSRVNIRMTFWRGASTSEASSAFTVHPTDGGSEVHWIFDEDRGFGMFLAGKLMFDRMMTGTFTSGLERLKALVEAEAHSA
ncbi:MAG TPA: SRPBCC family protein [Microbacteriaceae bacterium]|nr:SRPBCC family protein [Microbacteriaceae bacterium]